MSSVLEDEAVAILERPTLGGNPRTARAVAAAHLAFAERNPHVARTNLLRVAALRIRRIAVLVSAEALDDHQLARFVEEVFTGALRSLTDASDQPQPPEERDEDAAV